MAILHEKVEATQPLVQVHDTTSVDFFSQERVL